MKNIVTIGGGTGSFTLLSGLKKYPISISAIVSMADDGGSTGRLRDELGVLPPGDVRQCLVALSDESEEMRELFNYRFEAGDLKGHNFGNIFLSALEKINKSFSEGVLEAAKILNVRGSVIPVSNEKMNLRIKLKNGKVLKGESHLDDSREIKNVGVEEISLSPKVKAYKGAVDAIMKADTIVITPGDHFGSIVPNLLVDGISQALQKTKAKVVYCCNLTNKKGQTDGFDLDQYAKEVNRYIGEDRIDYVIFNSTKLPRDLVSKYEKSEGENSVVGFDRDKMEARSYKVILADILQKRKITESVRDAIAATRSFIRHDSDQIAKVIMTVSDMDDKKSVIKEIV
ncbi:MAG: YvcK family protein [Candidatus Moranbacteria bacterium]|nr:YvcK family protein [Candidatus Moranbacteria bacterium]